jgi:hypothetical protein
MRRRRLFLACALAIATVGLVAVSVSPALADGGAEARNSIGVRIVDVPQSLAGDPRAGLYIVDHVAPGTRIERHIEVSTTAATAMPIELYPAAATIAGGAFSGAEGRTANDLSSWMSIEPTAVDIPAEGTAAATVTISVPADAAPGEQYAVLWVQARSPAGAEGDVSQVSRVGIRVYLSVGPGGAPAADFEIDTLTAERSPNGQPFVIASVHNTGGRALDLNGTLNLLDGPGGLTAGPFPAQLGVTLGIGQTEPVEIGLDDRLPTGPWDARLTLASGLVERTVRGELTFPDSGAAHSVQAQSVVPAWLVPVLTALVAVLLSSVAVLAWFVVRRRRRM